jgi:ribosomal protein L40E
LTCHGEWHILSGMYCPHCGAQNAQETKFCRGCGEDLRLVSRAVTKSLPLVIAEKVDAAIDRGRGGWHSYQLFRREHRKAYGQMLMSACSLFVVVWTLMLGHGSVSFAGGFLLVMTLALLFTSAHDIWTKRRQANQASDPEELPSAFGTKELPAPRDAPAASVTETTTRRLKVKVSRGKAEDDLS